MKRIDKISIEQIPDESPDTSYLGEYSNTPGEFSISTGRNGRHYKYFNAENVENMEQAQQNFERMEALNNGHWGYIGIRARAEIATSQNGECWQSHKITSAGLWGIESDSDKSYFAEVGQDELCSLRDSLLDLGFTEDEIDSALEEAGLLNEQAKV